MKSHAETAPVSEEKPAERGLVSEQPMAEHAQAPAVQKPTESQVSRISHIITSLCVRTRKGFGDEDEGFRIRGLGWRVGVVIVAVLL